MKEIIQSEEREECEKCYLHYDKKDISFYQGNYVCRDCKEEAKDKGKMNKKICIIEVNENLRRVRTGEKLTRSLKELNTNCEFKKKYDKMFNIWYEEEIKEEKKINMNDMDNKIYELRKKGLSFDKISHKFHLSNRETRNIFHKMDVRKNRKK